MIEGDPRRLAALARALGGTEALRSRKIELGLTSDVVRFSRHANGRPTRRACLKCDAEFLSLGAQNRMCRGCAA